MRRSFFSLGLMVGLLTAWIPFPTFAGNAPAALKELEVTIHKEAAAEKPAHMASKADEGEAQGAEVRTNSFAVEAQVLIGQLKVAVTGGSQQEVEQLVRQITARAQSEAVKAAATKLRDVMRADSEAKDNAIIAQIEAKLNAASKAVKRASKPSDLDGTLRELDCFSPSADTRRGRWPGGPSERVSIEQAKLPTAQSFVMHWQDYLANLGAGKRKAALESLKSIRNENADFILLRSTLLTRINELATTESASDQVREIMAKAKLLEDIPAALAALEGMDAGSADPRNQADDLVPTLSYLLNSMARTYESYQLGVPTEMTLNVSKINGEPVNRKAESLVLPLRIELMRRVFPRFLSTDEKPKPNESIQQYLDRIQIVASNQLDVRLMARVLELMLRLDGKNDPVPEAFQILIAAQNQNEAGQFALAVISYESALKKGGEMVPAKVIGARLDAIKAAHPDEFKVGLDKFMTVPETATRRAPGSYSSPYETIIRIPGAVPGKS